MWRNVDRRGDLFVNFKVEFPDSLDPEAAEALSSALPSPVPPLSAQAEQQPPVPSPEHGQSRDVVECELEAVEDGFSANGGAGPEQQQRGGFRGGSFSFGKL